MSVMRKVIKLKLESKYIEGLYDVYRHQILFALSYKEYGIGGAHDTYGKDVHKGSGGDTLRNPATSKT